MSKCVLEGITVCLCGCVCTKCVNRGYCCAMHKVVVKCNIEGAGLYILLTIQNMLLTPDLYTMYSTLKISNKGFKGWDFLGAHYLLHKPC